MTASTKKIEFKIDHIDPLAQGVHKDGDNIFFIPKTLPEESGIARITKEKKGVHFALVEKLTEKSPKRINPECVHFDHCQGCHFLHCAYNDELEFKVASFNRMLSSIGFMIDRSDVIDSPQRLGYRNRVQLHYNIKEKVLGFINSHTKKIINVPGCLIANETVKAKVQELYKDDNWIDLAKKTRKNKGHVEIYEINNHIKISWNKRYADGGFTQVFTEMNNRLRSVVNTSLNTLPNKTIADLFGGNGNLTQSASNKSKRFIIDYYGKKELKPFQHHIDLYSEFALEEFQRISSNEKIDMFMVDPPRKGFPALGSWAERLSPEAIIYVSCHPQTMVRDLKSLGVQYKVEKVYLADLFPSTHHFEAIAIIKKNQ